MRQSEIIQVKSISQYYAISGLGKPKHPLIAIYPFSDFPGIDIQEKIRFTLGFYVVTLKRECNCKSQYGQTNYDYDEGVMGFTAPNQVFGADKDFYLVGP